MPVSTPSSRETNRVPPTETDFVGSFLYDVPPQRVSFIIVSFHACARAVFLELGGLVDGAGSQEYLAVVCHRLGLGYRSADLVERIFRAWGGRQNALAYQVGDLIDELHHRGGSAGVEAAVVQAW